MFAMLFWAARMTDLIYQGQRYTVAEGRSVLEVLEENQLPVLSSCRHGVCQSCRKKLVSGSVPAKAQAGLKTTEQALGYFLPCVCYPENDIEIEDVDAIKKHAVQIFSIKLLNSDIAEIQFTSPSGFNYQPGQYIQVFQNEFTLRTYSLASVPELNELLTLHVRKIPSGKVSPWIHQLKTGEMLEIAGPLGNCFYQSQDKNQAIMMISTGSGLAPHYGIARSALALGHVGKIYLFHGVEKSSNLYLEKELRTLAKKHENFSYVPCLSLETAPNYEFGMVLDVIQERAINFKNMLVFLSGHPEMVKKGSRYVFLSGARLQDIYADPFLH